MVVSMEVKVTSTLHSTPDGVNFAYANETVTFTCVTRGSSSMVWTSIDYISTNGGRIEYASIDSEGTSYHAGQTLTTLVSNSRVNGLVVLESQLQIVVQSNYQVSSVTCHNIGHNTENTTSFETAGT